MCDPLTFRLTPEAYACLIALAEKEGLNLQGRIGTVEYHHCTFTWAYEPDEQSLTIQCARKPFYVPCDTVNTKLHELVAAAQPAP